MISYISLENLYKKYKIDNSVFMALDNVSVKIEKGEFVSILGPSGSGKSTLMNIIGGLESNYCGEMLINGKKINLFSDVSLSKYRNKTIGFIFQNFNLDNSLTAIENVMQPLVYDNKPKKIRKTLAFEALCRVKLEERINNRPSELSGGQRQRVAIARAIVNKPQIILADEPTGNLDTKSGKLIMQLLSNLNKNGYTIIMVTHNPLQAALSKRTIEIIDGKITRDERNF
ncbi:MAG: ABC transporter ATP-binding protein [Clostridia bacterium]